MHRDPLRSVRKRYLPFPGTFSLVWVDALRDGLRVVRTVAFLGLLLELLNRPLEHFAVLAEDLDEPAGQAI